MSPAMDPHNSTPTIGEDQLRLLEKLCTACAVSGDEREVREIVLQEVQARATEVRVDALGNVLVTCLGERRDLAAAGDAGGPHGRGRVHACRRRWGRVVPL